ncbi:MAG TPA: FAD-binding oxidoreductase [Candidatus Nanopelagicaceae bacterium]
MRSTETQLTSGWGNNFHSLSTRVSAVSVEAAQEALSLVNHERGLLPVGLHRSYGDSALNSGGTLIDIAALNEISIDPDNATAIVGGGVTIAGLEKAALAHSLFPPVVPGTGYVTMGGAVAADIHGKSHHKTGSFSSCVRRIRLLLANGAIANYMPTDPEFWTTVGGLGLTGIILEIEITLRRVSSNSVDVSEHRVDNLGKMLELLGTSDHDYEHTVAWIDLSGDYRGRGVVSLGNYGSRALESNSSSSSKLSLPKVGGRNFITPITVKAFNEIWFRKPLKKGAFQLTKYMHPLDGINKWNRIYGDNGFLQYQFVVDVGREEIFERLFAGLRSLKASSFLGVVKKFGAASQAPMSFPRPGWTLTLDYSTSVPGLEKFLREFDQQLVAAGGRVYLIKDSRLNPQLVPIMYPGFIQWRDQQRAMDPLHVWQSDQARRLQLC